MATPEGPIDAGGRQETEVTKKLSPQLLDLVAQYGLEKVMKKMQKLPRRWQEREDARIIELYPAVREIVLETLHTQGEVGRSRTEAAFRELGVEGEAVYDHGYKVLIQLEEQGIIVSFGSHWKLAG